MRFPQSNKLVGETDTYFSIHQGQGLAMLTMKLTLATLFRRYELSLEPGFEMEYLPSLTLRPKKGLPVRVVRRTS